MNITDRAKNGVARITGDIDGAGVAMTIIKPDSTSFDIVGLSTKHHLSVDQESGTISSSMTASVSFSEINANAAGLFIRDAKGEVNLKGYHVKTKDSTDTLQDYVVETWFPDEKVGLIVCILGYYLAP